MINKVLSYVKDKVVSIFLGIICVLIIYLLYTKMSYYKDITKEQIKVIDRQTSQLEEKMDALVEYEKLQKKVEKENKERLKLIEESRNDKYTEKWMGNIAPASLLKRLQ